MFADCNFLYHTRDTTEDVISLLQDSSKTIFKWFSNNQMQENSAICNLILRTHEPVKMHARGFLIKSTSCEKQLGLKI